ncbi:MAG TPA: hypothetical protein VI583_02230 [Cyclobacteriaceae bacterium]|nr:hypothetical protein [Cyclobacteriaceae bacterium]
MRRLADEIGGQFSEYDTSKSVIIVPLQENRFQAVLGLVKYDEKFNKTGVVFSSKVCKETSDINLKELLLENAKTSAAKFVITDGYVKVEGSAFLENINENGLKEILIEVANKADEWELKLTGLDVN